MTRSNKKYCVMCGHVTSSAKGYCALCAERNMINGGAKVISGSSIFPQVIPIRGMSNDKDLQWNVDSIQRIYKGSSSEFVGPTFLSEPITEEAQPIRGLSELSPKSRLIAYNKFLSDVYRKPTRVSDLFEANGISEAQISRWKDNFAWIHHFLTVFQVLLEARLNLMLENSNPIILRWVYGLDGEDKLETSIISGRLSISEFDVAYCSKRLLQFLCSNEGHELIEETITHVINALGSA